MIPCHCLDLREETDKDNPAHADQNQVDPILTTIFVYGQVGICLLLLSLLSYNRSGLLIFVHFVVRWRSTLSISVL